MSGRKSVEEGIKSMNDMSGDMYRQLEKMSMSSTEVEYNYLNDSTILVGYPPIGDENV
jgi:hypothetical protein